VFFVDEEINKEAFLSLTESLVTTLLPKIGQRARFLAKLETLKKEVSLELPSPCTGSHSLRKQRLHSVPLSCFVCERAFTGWHSLTVHFKVYHSLLPSSNYVCAQGGCQRDFQSLTGLRRHIFAEHNKPVADDVHGENVCNYRDRTSEYLNAVSDDSDTADDDFTAQEEVETTRMSFFDDNEVCLAAARFVAKLRSHSSIPASVVDEILQDVDDCFSSELIGLLRVKTVNLLSSFDINLNDDKVCTLLNDFDRLGDIFSGLKTQHLQMKYFENSGCYIAPKSITVGHRLESKSKSGSSVLEPVDATAQYVPLSNTFKSFFALPGVFEKAKLYLCTGRNGSLLQDFVDGDLWRQNQIIQSDTKLVVPFVLHFDDFETVNPLGSRAGVHKLGAIYACLKCFPPRFNSQLKNLFLALMFYSEDRSLYGTNAVLRTLVEEIKSLQRHGIKISIAGQDCEIRFVLVQILGDNLGLNSILGYTESFSANHYCRVCRVSKHDVGRLLVEDKSLFRNADNYAADLVTNNVSETGIKGDAIWNEIPNFHVTHNCACDIMHDLFEGVCNYDMRHIIHYLVNERKFLSFEVLNSRIQCFDYGLEEASNKPPIIVRFTNPTESLNMKAVEMMRLVKYLSVMVGDLVPEGDDVWGLYLILCQIVQLVLASGITAGELALLRTLIAEHHELYVELFHDSLKPKHHFMVHYPSAIQSLGPLCYLWSMRFESKHGQAKKTANVMCNFRNICYSLSHKHQLKFCFRVFNNDSLPECDLVVGTGRMITVDPGSADADENDLCLAASGIHGQVFSANWISLNGSTYRPGQTLLIGVLNDMPLFGDLVSVVVDSSRIVYFVSYECETLSYVEHVNAYQVVRTSRTKCIKPQDLVDHRPLHRHTLPNSPHLQHLLTLHSSL